MRIVENFRLSSRLHELLKNITSARVPDPCIEFSVGPGPRSAFAEQQIAFPVQFSCGEEGVDILFAALHVASAFDDDGLRAGFREEKRGKESGGTGADHERMMHIRPVVRNSVRRDCDG